MMIEPIPDRPNRYFEVKDAQKTLPLVRRIVADVVHDYARWRDGVARYEMLAGTVAGVETNEQVALRQQIEALAEGIERYVEELGTIGCVLKDYTEGLVDFLARRDDRDVYLCWRLGEPTIDFWHELDGGFAGRQAIRSEVESESTF